MRMMLRRTSGTPGTLWGKVRAKVESTAAMVQDYSKPIVNGFVEHVQTQFTKENIHQFGRTTYDFSEQRYYFFNLVLVLLG